MASLSPSANGDSVHSAVRIFSDHMCTMCRENGATVTNLPCGHRSECPRCSTRDAQRRAVHGCAKCRQPVTGTTESLAGAPDSNEPQVTVGDALRSIEDEARATEGKKAGDEKAVAADERKSDVQVLSAKRMAEINSRITFQLSLMKNGDATEEGVQSWLERTFENNPTEFAWAGAQLVQQANVQGTLTNVDKYQERTVLQQFIVDLIEPRDMVMEITRGTLAGVAPMSIDVGMAFAAGSSVGHSIAAFTAVDGISAGLMCALFCAIDIYRYGCGQIDLRQLALNCGVNVLASTTGALASWGLGVGLGAVVGSFGGPIGTIVGAILGALIGGLLGAYGGRRFGKWLASKVKGSEEYEKELKANAEGRQRAAQEDAAKFLGIDLKVHSATQARSIFNRKILQTHPDKNSRPEARDEAMKVLAAWILVKGYYGAASEGGVRMKFLQLFTRDSIESAWTRARIWVNNFTHKPQDSDLQRYDLVEVFV